MRYRTVAVTMLAVLATIAPSARETPVVDHAPAELRVPANTAYLTPDPDAARISANRPVRPFVRGGIRLVWFGHFTERGDIDVAVDVRLAAGDSLPLRLAIGNLSLQRTVVGGAQTSRARFGRFTIADTGYQRIELWVAEGGPAPALEVESLVLDGPAAAHAHFNLDPRRNAASVHLRYPTDSAVPVTGFYNEITAFDDPVATYYMACGFSRGYFGMQVNSGTERRIIFSVWDAANGTTAKDRSTVDSANYTQLVAKGDRVVAEVCGNEGTGGHSHLVYPWKTGSTQRFFVTAKPDGDATVYTGYWFHPDEHVWTLIASFRAARDGKGLRRLYSFSENFGGRTGHLRRKALYGPPWIRQSDGSWKELTTATFTHDATGKDNRLDRFMGVADDQFFLRHGGFGPGFTESGTSFTRKPGGRVPVITLPDS